MVIDYWAHAHLDDPKLRETLATTDNFDAELARMEAEMEAEAAAADAEAADPAASGVTATVNVEPDPAGDPGEEWDTVADDRYGPAAGLS